MLRAPSVARGVLVIILIILLTGCREAVSTGPFPTSSYPTVTYAPRSNSPVLPNADVPRIAPTEVLQRLQAGEVITIVDTRSAAVYEIEHILGAVNLPEAEVEQRWTELPQDGLLVFYCG